MGVAAVEKKNVMAKRQAARNDTEIILSRGGRGCTRSMDLLVSDWSPCDASCDQLSLITSRSNCSWIQGLYVQICQMFLSLWTLTKIKKTDSDKCRNGMNTTGNVFQHMSIQPQSSCPEGFGVFEFFFPLHCLVLLILSSPTEAPSSASSPAPPLHPSPPTTVHVSSVSEPKSTASRGVEKNLTL